MEMGKETEMREKENTAPPKKKTKKATPTYDIPLGEFCRALDRYNEKHGTCYSYGQMSHAIDSGRISRKEFLKH